MTSSADRLTAAMVEIGRHAGRIRDLTVSPIDITTLVAIQGHAAAIDAINQDLLDSDLL